MKQKITYFWYVLNVEVGIINALGNLNIQKKQAYCLYMKAVLIMMK